MKEYKLSQLLEIKNGKDHKELPNGNYPVFGSGGIMRYVNKYLYGKPSILLPRKGSLNNIQYCDVPFWTVDTLYYTEVNEKLACPYYLYSYLCLLDLSGLDTGTGVPSMTFDSYYNIKVMLPEIEEQKRVASVLQNLDHKIALNRQINDNLEAMAKQLYDYWFVQFDFPNEDGKPYKSSGGTMVWNEKLKREIPQGWDSSMLQSICTIKRGASPRPIDDFMDESHKGMPWVKISDATNSNSPFMTTIKEHIILDGVPKSVKVIPSTLVVSNSATPGIPKFIQIEACVHDGWLVLTDYQEIYKYYLYYVIKMIRHNLLHIASGSIFKNLKTDYLKEFICITPSTEILSKYHNLVKPIMQEILLLQRDTEVLTKQRDELLPLLMNGQASVNYHLSAC